MQACPPSAGYRLRKLVRRHRGPVLAVSLVLLALVAGVIATGWQAHRAWLAEKKRSASATPKMTRSSRNGVRGEEAVRAGEQTLEALRAMTDAAMARHIGRQVQLSDHDREFFNQILILYQRLAAVQGSSRESRALRGRLCPHWDYPLSHARHAGRPGGVHTGAWPIETVGCRLSCRT